MAVDLLFDGRLSFPTCFHQHHTKVNAHPNNIINDGFVGKSGGQPPFTDCGLTVEQLWTNCRQLADSQFRENVLLIDLQILFSCAGKTFSKLCLILVQLVFQLRVIFYSYS